ncbi:MAG: RNA methyltransferase [Bacteroidetes bacterium]|jgi:23S rRNA (guanosine2251-2'-O)-methyltransferase|nr:RNA methyltransferase [Bacteroidota bacterium]MBT3748794.1 RNA methyltransferase [Bacteroidota bacterium]MBT4400831.1 RNA methyltransferase [Bacteroidota bacterium]MBT4411854.1 RNA methyltransferase [Bacteroidota bacterium]MBT7466350.1 RNA methyltransferase [Bacteroidota bacterium]
MRKLKNEELGRISAEEYNRNKKNPVVLVLDNVRSLNNIGSVFRTADGFRLEKVILCGISTCPPHREIHKTALGAENSVPWQYFATAKEAIEDLRSSGYTIMSVEQAVDSTQLPDLSLNGKTPLALIFGHEVKGVDQEVVDLSDECIEIPQSGTKHSFNISVSVGIVLWEVRAKL